MDWFRLHHGTPQDPKWIVVSRRARVPVGAVLSVWMTMLDTASRAAVRGTLEGWDHEDVAAMLGYETEQVAAIYDAMQGKTLEGDRVMAWDKRQPKRERDDDSAPRVRAHRDRNAAPDPVTPCNASGSQETPRGEERREEVIPNAAHSAATPPADPIDSTRPIDLKAELWRRGKAFLGRNGVPEARAGPILGKWRKEHGDAAVLDAMARAEAECASEVIPFVEACLKGKPRNVQHRDDDAAARRAAIDAGIAAAALRRMGPGVG